MNDLIKKALEYERENKPELCMKCYLEALNNFPNDIEVLYYTGVFYFRAGIYDQAFDLFVKCYSHKEQSEEIKEELLNHIFTSYYEPNLDTFKNTYDENFKNLLDYEHNHINDLVQFEELRYILIPRDEKTYYVFDKKRMLFEEIITPSSNSDITTTFTKDQSILIIDIYDSYELEAIHNLTFAYILLDKKNPLYLVWSDDRKRQVFMQLYKYNFIIDTGRFSFWTDCKEESSLIAYLKKGVSRFPTGLYADKRFVDTDAVTALLHQTVETRYNNYDQRISQLNEYYKSFDKKYYINLLSGPIENIKILFLTSRYTTFLQYCIRDCITACEELGLACDLLIEQSNVETHTILSMLNKIYEYRPNIFFMIDHFRWEQYIIPDNILFINWVHDPLSNIMSKESAEKICWNDFVPVAFSGFMQQMIHNLGYPASNLFLQTAPVNTTVYYQRKLTKADEERYASDITYVAHPGYPQGELLSMIENFKDTVEGNQNKSLLEKILLEAYDVVSSKIHKSERIYNLEDYKNVIINAALKYEAHFSQPMLINLATVFKDTVGERLHRAIPLTWLIEQGCRLKVWGNEWVKNPDFNGYAMGPAENGIELSKIYSASKITMGLHAFTTIHPRVFESIACGSLYICKSLPDDHDYENIRNYLQEDEDFVCFYNKEDLLEKLEYYLKNDRERKRIVENGKKKVLNNYTYKALMRNILDNIKSVLQESLAE